MLDLDCMRRATGGKEKPKKKQQDKKDGRRTRPVSKVFKGQYLKGEGLGHRARWNVPVLPRRVKVHGPRDRRAKLKLEVLRDHGSCSSPRTRRGRDEVLEPRERPVPEVVLLLERTVANWRDRWSPAACRCHQRQAFASRRLRAGDREREGHHSSCVSWHGPGDYISPAGRFIAITAEQACG